MPCRRPLMRTAWPRPDICFLFHPRVVTLHNKQMRHGLARDSRLPTPRERPHRCALHLGRTASALRSETQRGKCSYLFPNSFFSFHMQM